MMGLSLPFFGSAQIIDTAILGESEALYEVSDANGLYLIWTVEDGEIVSGQGTHKILVKWENSVGLKRISVYAQLHGNCLPDTSYAYIWVRELDAVYLANSFTPNGDGLNDDFRPMINSIGLKDYDFKILNRWGIVIFESKDPREAWDGKNKSGEMLEGVFICLLEVSKTNGFRYSAKQMVSIVH
ncbi:MAG: gliding motility-associated C-terminal domain-containing protein [bacterium]|nr:gliding motility-associated C-terminal domain-containing protein [bacterium]